MPWVEPSWPVGSWRSVDDTIMNGLPVDPTPSPARAASRQRVHELPRLDDEGLMAALQAGAHDALAILFDRYHRLVFSIALRIVRDEGEAEDVTQIVFLDVFRAAAQFDGSKGTCKVWLLQYAYHRAISR